MSWVPNGSTERTLHHASCQLGAPWLSTQKFEAGGADVDERMAAASALQSKVTCWVCDFIITGIGTRLAAALLYTSCSGSSQKSPPC